MLTKAAFNSALGARVMQARMRTGVLQDQLAQAVGLSRTSITNIEKGRQGVQAYVLVRIAEVLRCPASDLLPGLESRSTDELPETLKNLEPGKRDWAERVLRSMTGDGDAT